MMDTLAEIIINVLKRDGIPVPAKYTRYNKHPLAGMCYVASEVYYHLSPKNLKPMRIKMPDDTTHWFLQELSALGNPIGYIDLTEDQYSDCDDTMRDFLTEMRVLSGKRTAFLTKQPSKRAQLVIDRVLSSELVERAYDEPSGYIPREKPSLAMI
jgi:hypothetical protein